MGKTSRAPPLLSYVDYLPSGASTTGVFSVSDIAKGRDGRVPERAARTKSGWWPF